MYSLNRDRNHPASISLGNICEQETTCARKSDVPLLVPAPITMSAQNVSMLKCLKEIVSTNSDKSLQLITENVSMIKWDKDPLKNKSPDSLSKQVTLINETAARALLLKIWVGAPWGESESEISMSVTAAVVFAAVWPALSLLSLWQIRMWDNERMLLLRAITFSHYCGVDQ